MMGGFRDDVSDSAHDFERIVWPSIKEMVGGGRIIMVESETAKGLAQNLDIHAGIDAWQLIEDQSLMRGIASRIQWGPKSWGSFTIRMTRGNGLATEYEKRLLAIKSQRGGLYPHLTVQAYITEPRTGKLLSAAVVNTTDLYLLASNLHEHCKPEPGLWGIRRASNAEFLWASWAACELNGIKIKKFERLTCAA